MTAAVPAARPWGYGAVAAACCVAAAWAAWRWQAPGPSAPRVAGRIERLYPQARGRARDALAGGPAAGLALARVADARGWVAERGTERLDRAMTAAERPAAARARRLAAGSLALLAVATFADPGAARRVASLLSAPRALWEGGAWEIEPGDARVAYGAAVEGRARFLGPPAAGPLVLEWEAGGVREADTLGGGSSGTWRWSSVTAERRYRLRKGPWVSADFRLRVGDPLAIERLEARRPGGEWEPLAGAVVEAGERLEMRGAASEPLAGAAVVPSAGGEGRPLSVRGRTLAGSLRPAAGGWEVTLRAADGRTAVAGAFHAVPAGEAFVVVLAPADDPATIEAASVWIEARAGSPRGIGVVAWETADGRRGALAAAGGARDTVVSGLAPLALGAASGDTVRYRVVAGLADGGVAAGSWRTVVLAAAAVFREAADQERFRAAREAERAAGEAREAADRSPADAAAADEGLRRAADSLASAIDRTLADPSLPDGERARLEAYRELLRGAADADLARAATRGAAPPDPAAAARARAELVERVAAAVREARERAALAAAADSLERLAGVQRALAQEPRASEGGRLDAAMASRQEEVARSAREAADRLPPDAAADVESALERAAHAIEAGEPTPAAEAQAGAAGAMDAAAREARARSEEDARRAAERRAAVDRAAGETLFLAERQRAVGEGGLNPAERLARQRVVVQGVESMLAALVEGMGGRPAAEELGRLLAESVYATRRAESALARPGGEQTARAVAHEAAQALALLARAFLVPPGGLGMSGAGQGESGSLARQMDALAAAQRAVADAAGRADDPAGGNPEAAAAERRIGTDLGEIGEGLEAQGVDRRAVEALVQAVEEAARRLERGLPGARAETELRSLARRFADLGRIVQQSEGERRAEAARPFVPAEPPALPSRATARRLDPEAALAPWRSSLPRPALDPARAYLERLAEEGVRAP